MADQAKAVTGRPNDIVEGQVVNSTLSSRAAARRAPVEDKKVPSATGKRGQKVESKDKTTDELADDE